MAAVETARRIPGVEVVSMSWGFSEVRYQSSSHFTTPAGHTGITFVAASGDNGLDGGTNWPAVEPNVLSVGGTSLSRHPIGDLPVRDRLVRQRWRLQPLQCRAGLSEEHPDDRQAGHARRRLRWRPGHRGRGL